ISTVGFGNNGLAKANLHGANDQKVLAGGDRESVGAGFTDSGLSVGITHMGTDICVIAQLFSCAPRNGAFRLPIGI
ncbi:hypothetical protein, partial [Halomonas sp. 15WGF]|uniref:hypothetical protein n=1 Tax=Halomonas sp. 15WGF TaxID=2570357 RepID=UPI001BAE76F7